MPKVANVNWLPLRGDMSVYCDLALRREPCHYYYVMLLCYSSSYDGRLGVNYYVMCHPTIMVGWATIIYENFVILLLYRLGREYHNFRWILLYIIIPCPDLVMGCVGIIQYLCCIYPVFTYMYLWRFGISYVASSTWECVRANRAQCVRCDIFVAKIPACELNFGCRDFSLDWDNRRNCNTSNSIYLLLSCAYLWP